MNYYSEDLFDIKESLQTSEEGLSPDEAAKRLTEHGKNALQEKKKKPLIVKFLEQFKDVMIIVLIAAAIVSAALTIYTKEYSELIESGLILLIVIVNAIIGVVQENKAESALEALKNLNKPYSKVIRGGALVQIKSEEIVPGDVVQLEAGDIVPCDLRLFSSASLKIEEAALTGESVPVEKDADAQIAENAPLGDRKNMAYGSGIVSYGRGRGIAVHTGMETEVGKIAKMLETGSDDGTPLQKQLNKTAKVLSVLVLAIAVVIFAVSLADDTSQWINAFMTAVAIAVAAIPEGLPAVVTVVLAIGVQRMSKRNAIIRNLPAVETLGCCEIICSDKTGTLTLNKMTVKRLYTVSGGLMNDTDYAAYTAGTGDADVLVRAMTLCNDTTEGVAGLAGDPTETALVAFYTDKGGKFADLKEEWRRVDEVPFDSVRKMMTTVNEHDGKRVAHIKGATDIMLKECKKVLDGGKVREMTADDIESIGEANAAMASHALRVLGVAVKYDDTADMDNIEKDMVFVGLVGMIDPPRPEVKDAVKVAIGAGMRPIMITGDHRDTAAAIAKEIGILRDGDKVMEGCEIDALSDEEFRKVIKEYSVFARVSPENKVRIVRAYRSFGHVVAMTGDGVNDAPSIKEADIGIGMGITGTDVSKGAADMILADDNFATIVSAVEEGRKIFQNIKKAIQFLLSANIAEVLCLFIATVFLKIEFLTPIMILWVNLVTDSLPALSLGMEKAESDVMNRPPRKTGGNLFRGKMGLDIVIQGIMQTGLVMLSFCLGHYVLDASNEYVGMTMAFISLCMIQLFHSYNLKRQGNSIVHKDIFDNKWLNISFLVGAGLILLITLIPVFHGIFDIASLNAAEWFIALGCAFAIIPLVEIQKLIENVIEKYRKHNKK